MLTDRRVTVKSLQSEVGSGASRLRFSLGSSKTRTENLCACRILRRVCRSWFAILGAFGMWRAVADLNEVILSVVGSIEL